MNDEEYRVLHVRPEDCYSVWPKVKAALEPAIERTNGRWKPEYVFAALINGAQTLWVVIDSEEKIQAGFTTEIITYPERRMLMIHYLGGTGFDKWFPHMREPLLNFSRHFGCQGIELNGRAGFWKWLKKEGFKRSSIYYEMDI